MKKAVGAAALVAGAVVGERVYSAVGRVRGLPEGPPKSTVHFQSRHAPPNAAVDCFERKLTKALPKASAEEDPIVPYARTFFTSPVFRCERFVLGLAGRSSPTDGAIDALQFRVGDQIAGSFTVVERRADQVLLRWQMGSALQGTTFLAVPAQAPAAEAGAGAGSERRLLLFGSSVGSPDGKSQPGSFASAAHGLYSKVLLDAAARRLEP